MKMSGFIRIMFFLLPHALNHLKVSPLLGFMHNEAACCVLRPLRVQSLDKELGGCF